MEDQLWELPGDSIRTPADERRDIEAQGDLAVDEVGDSIRRPVAVILDRLMRLERRVEDLEPGE